MRPLNNRLLIFTFLLTNIKYLSWKAFYMVTFFIFYLGMISWCKFPKLMIFFWSFWNYDTSSIAWWTILRCKNHIIFSTENGIFSTSNWSDSKFLVGSLIPLKNNGFVKLVGILRDIKYHVISHGRNESIEAILWETHFMWGLIF